MNIKPLPGRILLEILPDSQASTIILAPETQTQQKPHRGRALAVGVPVNDMSMPNVGDTVHFKPDYKNVRMNVEGKDCVFIVAEAITGIE